MTKAPEEYSAVLTARSLELKSTFNIEEAEDAMHVQWGITRFTKKGNKATGKEIILQVDSSNGSKCTICGSRDHIARFRPKTHRRFPRHDKPDERRKDDEKFKGRYNHYGMLGHKKADCWKLHSKFRLKNGKFKSKINTGGMRIETILMTHDKDNSPMTEEEIIMRKHHNDINSVDSYNDWVSSCDHCGVTGKPNQNECFVCKVGELDAEDNYRG